MDATYKRLFSRPRMVRDLLQGVAARGWSGGGPRLRLADSAAGQLRQPRSALLADVSDPDRLAEVGDLIIECGTAAGRRPICWPRVTTG